MHVQTADRIVLAPRRPSRPLTDHQASHTLFGSAELLGTPMSFGRDAEIYGENEPSDYIYMILSGTVRVYKILQDGRRQVVVGRGVVMTRQADLLEVVDAYHPC